MSKKRVVLLINNFGVGGAQNMVFELAKNLDRDAYDTSIICYSSPVNTHLEKQVEALFPVVYLHQKGSITPCAIAKVIKAIDQIKPDVVHAHLGGAGFGAIWALLTGKSFVVTVHTKPQKAFSPKIERLVRLALKYGNTTLVAVSKENEKAIKAYFDITGSKCRYVNNGIDLERFDREPHPYFTLINVAHHDDNKNQAVLIRCFARLNKISANTRLILLGDGPTHKQLVDLVSLLGLNDVVTFTGNVFNTQDYYAKSDLYVQCSHREAMPLSVLEAMAAGLPIVSTNVGGLVDIVRDNGALVEDNNEDALYNAIEHIFTQSLETMESMCKSSKRIVQDYSSENMARAYERIYNEI